MRWKTSSVSCEGRSSHFYFPFKQAMKTPIYKEKLFFDFDGFRYAFLGGLPNQVMVFLRNLVKLDDGQQLVLVILEDLGTEFVAVAIPHALAVNTNFH